MGRGHHSRGQQANEADTTIHGVLLAKLSGFTCCFINERSTSIILNPLLEPLVRQRHALRGRVAGGDPRLEGRRCDRDRDRRRSARLPHPERQ